MARPGIGIGVFRKIAATLAEEGINVSHMKVTWVLGKMPVG